MKLYWSPADFFLFQTSQLFQKSEPIELNSEMAFLVSLLYSVRLTNNSISPKPNYRKIQHFLLILYFQLM